MLTSRQRQSTAGMTILEVLAVVIILGILSAIVAPGWLTFVNRQRTNRAQDQILQAIRQAQSEARRLNRNQTVEFIPETETEVPKVRLNSGLEIPLGEGDLKPGMLSMTVLDDEFEDETNAAPEERTMSFLPNGALDPEESDRLTIIVSAPADAANPTKRCVVVQTLLGATDLASDGECPTPVPDTN
ncbi:MAG: Tfp pilus assembly protein FimT/FimU [Elainellaceae cyanobacterium]